MIKPIRSLLLLLLAAPAIVCAQRNGLVNSGEVLKEGAKLYDSAHYKQALNVYKQISRSDTNYVRSLYERSIACEADSQFNQAIAYCKEGLAMKEQREYEPDLYNTYGNTLSDLGKYDEADKLFDAAIAKYPLYYLLYYNKACVQLALKNYPLAEALFKRTLIMNPYMNSAHYQLGMVALKQGKIVPAFLSFIGYMIISPEGKSSNSAINAMSQIAKGTDEILAYKNKRTETPDGDYQMMEDILLSKIALDKQYKPIIALDDAITRQIQVLFEKLDYHDSDTDFWKQYYLPFYKHIYKDGKFELMVNDMFMDVKVAAIQDYNNKHKKELEAFRNDAGDYFALIRSSRELMYNKRDAVASKYAYDDGRLVGKGQFTNNGKTLVGDWDFYYATGNRKGQGKYNDAGKREGEWKYYFFSGKLKALEHYTNGELEGEQLYYFENGNLSSRENYANKQPEGLTTVYYYAGNKKSETNFKLGKKDGEERTYYASGILKAVNNFTAGVQNGPSKEYYKSGRLQGAGTYTAGKAEGPYKSYYEDGMVSAEMQFSKDNLVGEWRSYYENGKPKGKAMYANGLEEGPHIDYYENGEPSCTFTAQKGKLNGEVVYYGRTGKPYVKYQYDNGMLKAAKYFDVAGTQTHTSVMKGNALDMVSYDANGAKSAHLVYDQKGNINGVDTLFYPSGKIKQILEYKDGEPNGSNTTYYLNGKKKAEIYMVNGKQTGYYQSYFVNGKPEAEGWLKDDENEGEWLYYDITGRLSSRSNYLSGELNGYKEEYAANGKKTVEQRYRHDWLDEMTQYDEKENVIAVDSFPKGSGKYTLLYPNGKVMAQTNYVNGDFDGLYKSFFFDGSVETSFYYNKGALDSTYASYYYGGNKMTEGKYHLGKKAGMWKSYNEDGKLYYTSTYANDVLNGERIYYNEDGSKDFVSLYKDDDLDGLAQKFDPDGTLAYQVIFEEDNARSYTYQDKDGKLLPFTPIASNNGVFKSYYTNGKVSRECNYSDGEKHGTMTLYYSNGQVRSIDNSIYGISEGESKEYYPNGKLKQEYLYLSNDLNGPAKEYYANGTVKKEMNYENGYNHGAVKYYDAGGKLTKTLLYDHGRLISAKNEK